MKWLFLLLALCGLISAFFGGVMMGQIRTSIDMIGAEVAILLGLILTVVSAGFVRVISYLDAAENIRNTPERSRG